MSDTTTAPLLVEQAGRIVQAYVAHNALPPAEIGGLLRAVHTTLTRLAEPVVVPLEQPVEQPSAAEIRKSIGDDGLISFIDGKTYKTLKRHLTTHGLDPRSYRERYGLPVDYPMVAPAYAAERSALAKQIGLGRPGGMAARQADAPALSEAA